MLHPSSSEDEDDYETSYSRRDFSGGGGGGGGGFMSGLGGMGSPPASGGLGSGPTADSLRYTSSQSHNSTPSHDHRASVTSYYSGGGGGSRLSAGGGGPPDLVDYGGGGGPSRSGSSRSYSSQPDSSFLQNDGRQQQQQQQPTYQQSQSYSPGYYDNSRKRLPSVDQRSLSGASQDNISLSAASSSGFHSRTASAHSTHGGGGRAGNQQQPPTPQGGQQAAQWGAGQAPQDGLSPQHQGGGGHHHQHGHHHHHSQSQQGGGGNNRISPSPSMLSAKTTSKETVFSEQEKVEREEEERKKKLQLYVFIMRCIAYPFCAKHPTELPRRYLKLTKQQLQALKERFQSFLNGETSIVADEAFTNALQSYYEVFIRSDRVATMVKSGGCSMFDFREVFRINIEKRIRCLPEMEDLRKETVLSKWLVMFDQISRGDEDPRRPSQRLQVPQSEAVLTKEQLYDLFQNIIGIKKYEHQILYNACQLDNADEQAAQVRRELDAQLQCVEDMSRTRKYPKLVVKEMEELYQEELRTLINELMGKLESVPVTKGPSSFQKFKKHNRHSSSTDDSEININKLDIQLNFALEVVVIQVKNLNHLSPNKIVFCIMEIEGGEKLQTDQAEASKPYWHTQGDFTTFNPLCTVKVKLCTESGSILMDHKEIGRVVLKVTCTGNRQPEWHKLQTSKSCPDQLAIQLCIRMDKPTNLKYCGYCYALGKVAFKKWKRRYICLIQVSQYTSIMASFRDNKPDPLEIMQLDSFTVDYCDTQPDLSQEGGKFFFNLVREGDSVMLATDDENERQLWVQAVYRATGQSHKPTPPTQSTAKNSNALSRAQGDADKARKHGLDEFVTMMPCNLNHNEMFRMLQRLTLEFRLLDPYASQGWFSPGQMFTLDEYCSRYGVRGCHRHLCYISDLLDKAETGVHIDPDIIHFSYDFCSTHVFATKQDAAIRTVTVEERDKFFVVKERLLALLAKQITEFRYCFPFGRPERALKKTLGLLERVLMKETGAPASPEEVRNFVKNCLEQAALVNYTRISEYASIEGNLTDDDAPPAKKLDDVIHLGELCIEVLQQNEEHHAEDGKQAFAWFSDVLAEHSEIFWSLFAVDMSSALDQQPPDCWDSFPLFQLLNDYIITDESLVNGKFHLQLQEIFAPQVLRYVELMESSISQSVQKGLEKERWSPVASVTSDSGQGGCASAEELIWKISALHTFIKELHWPDEELAEHLDERLKQMAASLITLAAERIVGAFEAAMKRANKGTDFIISQECCVMMNTLIDLKAEVFKLCTMEYGTTMHEYQNRTEETLEKSQRKLSAMLSEKLMAAMEGALVKLARYDESSLLSSFLSLAEEIDKRLPRKPKMFSLKPTDEMGKEYVDFMRGNMEQLRNSVSDELLILSIYESWYTAQVKMIKEWLTERADLALNPYQINCLSAIIKKMYSDFELQGIDPEVLDTSQYQAVLQRIQVEEATCSVKQESSKSSKPSLPNMPGRSLFGSISGTISGSIGSLSNGIPTPSFFSKG